MYSLNNIIENDSIKKYFKNSIKNNLVANCYILQGFEQTGKETIFKSFAKSLLCENFKDDCCNNCSSCISFEGNNNPDFIYINSENTITIDEIRQKVIKNFDIKPFKYKYKIFFIKNADNMTIQAQNAILKTIEEPHKYAIFLFTTKNYRRFLKTILSRSILLKTNLLQQNTIEQYLQNIKVFDKNLIPTYCSYSQGSLGNAIQIATSENFIQFRNDVLNNILKLYDGDLITIYEVSNNFEEYKTEIQKVLDILLLLYRDCLIYKQTNDFSNLIQKDFFNLVSIISENSFKNLVDKIDVIFDTKLKLQQNSNFNMTIEYLFLKLKEK